jgi:phosphonate transport system permease protein
MSGSVDREWQRFTPGRRVLRYAVYLATAVAFGLALRHIEVVPEFLADTPTQVADLLVRMWPVDWGFLASTVIGATVETIHRLRLAGERGTPWLIGRGCMIAAHARWAHQLQRASLTPSIVVIARRMFPLCM